jgi:hypothetical protein
MSATGEPERLVERFSRGYRAGRYAEVYDLFSEESEIRRAYTRESYASRMRSTAQRTKMAIKESKIGTSELTGNTARVTLLSVTNSIVGQWHMEEEFTLRKEAGGWKILGIAKMRQWPIKGGGTAVRGRM